MISVPRSLLDLFALIRWCSFHCSHRILSVWVAFEKARPLDFALSEGVLAIGECYVRA